MNVFLFYKLSDTYDIYTSSCSMAIKANSSIYFNSFEMQGYYVASFNNTLFTI